MKEERKIIDGLKKAGMQVVEEFDTASFRKVVYDTVRAAYVEKLGATLDHGDRSRTVKGKRRARASR